VTRRWAARGAAALAVLATGCRLTPLTNRLAPGQDAYVVFVGEGPGGETNLYASGPGGGEVFQLTFSREREERPALDPTGVMVAFLRRGLGDRPTVRLVVMNLISANEREAELPDDPGGPLAVGWSASGDRIVVGERETDGGSALARWWTDAPPGRLALVPVPDGQRISADSALDVVLGVPPLARVAPCPEGQGICVETRTGTVQRLADEGRDAMRWGADSVAWFTGNVLTVRSLGGGYPHRLTWGAGAPANAREASYFPGAERGPDS